MRTFVVLIPVIASIVSCASQTPEQQVRARIGQIERAAENGEVDTLVDFVSEAYADPAGRTRREMTGLARYHLMQRQSLHVFSRVGSVDLDGPGEARVSAYVALASQPIDGARSLATVQAELYRADFSLRREGDVWRMTAAEWSGGSLSDFLE